MSYLHCHNCDWSQDDFYNWPHWNKYLHRVQWGYNPIMKALRDIRFWIYPRRIQMSGDVGINATHTWRILVDELLNVFKSAHGMKWWSYKSFKQEKNKLCPNCGSKKLDID